MEISRLHGRVPELQTGIPNEVVVTNPTLVRALARALCGLPPMPRDVLHCPALFLGTSYILHFTVNGRPLPTVSIQGTGCEAVTGVGPVRRATSPAFWQTLTRAVGRIPPGPPVYTPAGTVLTPAAAVR